jgi:transposase InsO family protein
MIAELSAMNAPFSLDYTEAWITCERAGQLVGLSGRRVRQIAGEKNWPTISEAVRGGICVKVRLDDVIGMNAADGPLGAQTSPSAPAGGDTGAPGADRRSSIIAPIAALKTAAERNAAIAAASAETGKSVRTLQRWLAAYRADLGAQTSPSAPEEAGEDPSAPLGTGSRAPGISLRDKRFGNRNAAKWDVEVLTLVKTLYDTRVSPTIVQVAKAYEFERRVRAKNALTFSPSTVGRERGGEAGVRALPALSTRTIARILESIPDAYKTRHRGGDGARFVRKNFVPPIKRDWSGVRVMECWMGDGTGFDALVSWPGYKNPIRPWLLTWMDVRSRAIVAWRLVDQVNGGTAMLALREGWRKYGLCSYLYIDNGKEYENKDSNGRTVSRGKIEIGQIDGYLGRLGVHKQNAWVRNPESKAQQERWYGTFSHSYLNLFSAYTGGNITAKTSTKDNDRIKQDLAAGRVMDREEAVRLVERIVAAYNAAPHTSLGKLSPIKIFNDLYARSADGVDDYPIRRVTDRVLDFALMRRAQSFTIRNDGVEVLGVTYNRRPGVEADMMAFVEAVGRRGHAAYDPDDLSTVHLYAVVNGRESYVCELVPDFGVKVGDEEAMSRAVRDKKRAEKIIAEASKALVDRQIQPRAIETLREGVLAVNDETSHAEHEQRFGGVSPCPPDGRGAGGEGAGVVQFPAGGIPKTQKPAAPLRGLFGDL